MGCLCVFFDQLLIHLLDLFLLYMVVFLADVGELVVSIGWAFLIGIIDMIKFLICFTAEVYYFMVIVFALWPLRYQ